ncbi:hypothetical protein [Nocardia sp. NPDC050412]|uniref:hypothetical protein n=1 Tax=unclassified Nocardia TaxID=2637762 RepID=UPI0037B8680D
MAIPPVPAPLGDHYRQQHRQHEGADTVLAQFVLFDGFDPRIANAVEKLIAPERRGTVWRNTGHTPAV